MRSMKKTLCLLLALVMVFALAACGPSGTNNAANNEVPGNSTNNANNVEPAKPQPQYGGVFHLAKTTSPTSLFPIYKSVNGGGNLTPCLETLGYQDPLTNEITGRLVKEFTRDPETGNITCQLVEGVLFHDGSELTADVVKWNFDFMTENGQASSIYSAKVNVTGKYTFVLEFPAFHLDSAVALVTSICSQKAYEEKGLDYCINHPVGTGPFKFVEYVPDLKIVYERNENYWRKDDDGNKLPYLDGYQVDMVPTDTATQAFLNGQIDSIEQAGAAQIQMIEAEGYTDQHRTTFTSYSMYGFAPNTKVADDVWADVNVRKAVMLYGINYEELAPLAGGKLAVVRHTFDADGALCFNPDISGNYKYDLEKAKKMLADAGYPNGFSTTIYAQDTFKAFATALQNALKPLGIEASVELIKSADTRRSDGKTPGLFISLQYAQWDVMSKPMTTIYNQKGTTQGKNILFSDEYQALFNEASSYKTYEERGAAAKKLMQKFFIDDCLYVVCYGRETNVYIRPDVHNSGCEIKMPSPATTWKEQAK